MLLFSFNFFVFLTIAFIVYYMVGIKYRYLVLFVTSTVFVSFISIQVALYSVLFATINYFIGILLKKNTNKPKLKNRIFWAAIVFDIGFLAFFKYINFIFKNVNDLAGFLSINAELPYLNIITLVGISYYTFQALGYVIRVNRGAEEAILSYPKFATYLLFFPKFLSGPVERSNHFFPQIDNLKKFDQAKITEGLRLFLWGAFKKVVIADTLYAPVSLAYNNVHEYSGVPLIIVFIIQFIYVYCDFSGYTDMALGAAKLFGIDLVDNFRRPFLARNISEFWKRWHISLSSWCNDFIFYPFIVKFRKLGDTAAVLGIFVTFLIIGVWHGANWTFVVLGLLHGFAIIYEFYTKRFRTRIGAKLPKFMVDIISWGAVYVYMCVTLVFFFSKSLSDALYYFKHMFVGFEFVFKGYGFFPEGSKFPFALLIFALIYISEIISEKKKNIPQLFFNQPKWVRWAGYYILILLIFIYTAEAESFVYMEF